MGMGAYQKNESTVEIMSTLMNICGHTDKWWSDEVYEYTLQALTDEIIEKKQGRTLDKKLSEDSYDFVVHFNQVI